MPSFTENFDHWSKKYQRTSLDGLRRRRVYLVRHGDVLYFLPNGQAVPDSTAVELTDQGVIHAKQTGEAMSNLQFDRVIASGYPRTVQTCEGIVNESNLELPAMELMPELVELRGDRNSPRSSRAPHPAYSLNPATAPGGVYNGGESFLKAQLRASNRIAELLKDDFNQALIVAHGGINRLIMSWALGIDLNSTHVFEQDYCGINILDLYTDEFGALIRGICRGINITAYDALKADRKMSTLETMCIHLSSLNDWDPATMESMSKQQS